jgi:hypothetical protein
LHGVELSAPVELNRVLAPVGPARRQRTSFAHPEDRVLVEHERQVAVVLEREALHDAAVAPPDGQRQGTSRCFDSERPYLPLHRRGNLPQRQDGGRVRPRSDGRVLGKLFRERQRFESHPDAAFARHPDIELGRLADRRDRLCLGQAVGECDQ